MDYHDIDPAGILSQTQYRVACLQRQAKEKDLTYRDFDELFEARVEKLRETGLTKGRKYTLSTGDRLANFKQEAEELGLTPFQVWHVFFNKHVRAVADFCRRGQSIGEELVENHIHDCLMYLFLLEGLIAEFGRISVADEPMDGLRRTDVRVSLDPPEPD